MFAKFNSKTHFLKSFPFFSRFIAFALKVGKKVLILHENKNFCYQKCHKGIQKNAEFAADKKTYAKKLSTRRLQKF
jgi:hypothetical protein